MSDVKGEIDNVISEYKVVVFSKTTCPYCAMAKKAFSKVIQDDGFNLNADELKVIEISNTKYQDVLQKMTGARTVPRIFINGKCIGGWSDMEELLKSGKLKEKLLEARKH